MWHYLNDRTVYPWLPSVALAPSQALSVSRNVRRGDSALSALRDRGKARTGLLALNKELFLSDPVFSKTKMGTHFPAVNCARIVNTRFDPNEIETKKLVSK